MIGIKGNNCSYQIRISPYSIQLYQLTGFSSKDNFEGRKTNHIKLSRGLSVGGGGFLKNLTCCRNKDSNLACETKCRPYNGKYRKWALKIDCVSKFLFPISYITFVVLYLPFYFLVLFFNL